MMREIHLFFLKWLYRLKRLSARPYRIEGAEITLPPGHLLDWYQRLHPLYDRFLPFLAGNMNRTSVVLDIGANIGDSAIPFLRHGMVTWCVEPAQEFVGYLRSNLAANNLEDKAPVIECMITQDASNLHLKVERGTAFRSSEGANDKAGNAMTLDELLNRMGSVDLIKSDTDGFDHDVLRSGLTQIARLTPMIFFENTCTPENRKAHEEVYEDLEKIGYQHVCIFDNKGNILAANASWEKLREFNDSILNGKLHGIPYLDVFTATAKHGSFLKDVIERYRTFSAMPR